MENIIIIMLSTGTASFVMGFFFSVKLEVIGVILVCGTGFDFLANFLIRKSTILLENYEASRKQHQESWDAGEIPDTPAERKALKDEYDKVRSLDWALSRNIWLKYLNYALTIYLILLIALFFGPGKIISWTLGEVYNVGKQNIEKFADKPIVSQAMGEGETEWDNKKLLYIQNLLIREKSLTADQYENIVKLQYFSPDAITSATAVKMLAKSSKFTGNNLFYKLSHYLSNLTPAPANTAISPALTQKGWWQKKREEQWLLLCVIEIIYAITILCVVIAIIASTILQFLFSIRDEAWDQIQEKFAEAMTKKSGHEGQTQAATPSTTATPRAPLSMSGEVFSSVVGSSIADFFVKVFLRK